MIVRPAPPEHLPWIASRAGLFVSPAMRAIEAVDGDRIVGMVAFDGWTKNACCMHQAIDSPIAMRRLLRPAFGIPFIELGLNVVVGTVLSTNTKALDLDMHLGFREVMRGRDWWAPGVDMIWIEMRREECRWIPAAEQNRKAA